MSNQNISEVTVSKSELESLALAVYQAALDDAYINGMITAEQKGELLKTSLNETIEFEAKSFFKRKSPKGKGHA